jgi:TatA/E family protein of Tat protein translocase
MFGTLGGPELLLILVLALIVFGPRKLPEVGRSMGRMLAEFRKASHEFQRTIEDEVEAEKAGAVLPAPGAVAPPAPPADPQPPAEATVGRGTAPDAIEPK